MIMKPKDRMFHNREMPDGVFKVNVASVLAGFEDLPPPVPVNDDETPKMIGACKNWFFPWPKSLLRLEAPSITPTPPSQESINTTHLLNYLHLSWQVVAYDARESLH